MFNKSEKTLQSCPNEAIIYQLGGEIIAVLVTAWLSLSHTKMELICSAKYTSVSISSSTMPKKKNTKDLYNKIYE